MDAKVKIELYVTEPMIKANFGVQRDYELGDDDFQEKCDCTDMSPYDIDIATLQFDDTRLELSTTCDRWNVYFVLHQGDATTEVKNVSLDSKEWQSVADVIDFLVDAAEL